jgi:5-methyltetrahydrofolate--homocysteine methyltransferase
MSARDRLSAAAADRILVTDGAFGTEIQNRKLGEADYRGALDLTRDQKGNNDILALTRPDLVDAITRAYLEAGADIVSTNTFSANTISQADYGAEALVADINRASARLARAAANDYQAKDGRPRFVAGAIGPTNKTLSLSPRVNDPGFREIDFDGLKRVYLEQCEALIEGGADFILIETIFDTLNAKAGIMAAIEAGERAGRDVPLMISMTITDLSGRNLSGHTVEAFWHAVRHARPLTIGPQLLVRRRAASPRTSRRSPPPPTRWSWSIPMPACPTSSAPMTSAPTRPPPSCAPGRIRAWSTSSAAAAARRPRILRRSRSRVAGLPPRRLPTPPVVTRLAGPRTDDHRRVTH